MTHDRTEFDANRAAFKAMHHEQRLARRDLAAIKRAIEMLPATCRYHGDDLLREYGVNGDRSCCDTGKPAIARRQAEDAIRRYEA